MLKLDVADFTDTMLSRFSPTAPYLFLRQMKVESRPSQLRMVQHSFTI